MAPLKDQHAIDGCSWSASAPALGNGLVFLAEYDESRVLMNIDGSDMELTLVEAQGELRDVGDVAERTFTSGEVTVRARYTVTWTCPQEDESCEVTRYSAEFTVDKDGRSETLSATGDVGC